MKTICLAALVCAISSSSFASAIDYTITATGSGIFDNHNFTNALVTVSFSGDDQAVQFWNPTYVNRNGVTRIAVQGFGSGVIANGYVYANSMNDPASVGIADFDQGGATIMGVRDNQLGNYQLGDISPFTTASSWRSDVTFDTTSGAFQMTALGPATFSAVSTVSTVPLPASLPMFAAALFGLGVVRLGLKRAANMGAGAMRVG